MIINALSYNGAAKKEKFLTLNMEHRMKKLLSLATFLLLLVAVADGQGKSDSTKLCPTTATSGLIFIQPRPCVIFTIDTTGTITIPKGWEQVIVIRNSQVWAADSSGKNISFPQDFWRKKRNGN